MWQLTAYWNFLEKQVAHATTLEVSTETTIQVSTTSSTVPADQTIATWVSGTSQSQNQLDASLSA
jgi:hypothetical protein